MNALIGQMLDLARGVGGEAAQPIALEPWLQQRRRLHEAAAAQAHSHLAVSCPAGLQAQAAPGALGRIVDNLLDNALRHAPGAIELSAHLLTDRQPATVCLSVRDHGAGIPPEQLDQVWRPFQRVEGSRSPKTGGCGLGLAIVRQMAQAQHWPVALCVHPQGGVEASVELPVAAGDAIHGTRAPNPTGA